MIPLEALQISLLGLQNKKNRKISKTNGNHVNKSKNCSYQAIGSDEGSCYLLSNSVEYLLQLDKKKHVCYNEEQNKTPFRSTALRKVV